MAKKKQFQTAAYKQMLSDKINDGVARKNLKAIFDNLDNIILVQQGSFYVILLGTTRLGWTEDITRVDAVYANQGWKISYRKFEQCIPILDSQ